LALISQPLGLPEKSVTILIILLLIGFPFYIFFLWKSKFRHIKSDLEKSVETNILNEVSFKRKYFIALGLTALVSFATAGLIINNNYSSGISLSKSKNNEKIAVLNFTNNTGDPKLDNLGKMTADWLIHGITENEAGEVISSEVLDNYTNLLGVEVSAKQRTNILSKFLNPSKVVTGEFFLNDSTLIFNCTIKDALGTKTIFAFTPVKCSVNKNFECIENLRQEVTGYLALKDNDDVILEDFPPKFEAYEKILDAMAQYAYPDEYLKLLNDAIEIDEEFFEPKILKAQLYYNLGEYKTADSLINELAIGKRFSKKQQNFINFLRALLDGENAKIFNYYDYQYNLNTQSLESNSTQMTLALQYINRPDLVKPIFDVINMSEMNIENCSFCKFRYGTLAHAYNQLEEYQKGIDLLNPVTKIVQDRLINRQLATAYVRSNQLENLNNFLNSYKLKNETAPEKINDLYLYVGREFLLLKATETANSYFNKVIEAEQISDLLRAKAYYYKEDFSNAEVSYKKIYETNKRAIIISRLAVACYKNGKEDEAKQLINTLQDFRETYDYGNVDYCYAQYLIATGQDEFAIEHLLKSIIGGNIFTENTFQNDSHFVDLLPTPQFQEIITYWHN
jgi:hypothetical protein